MARSRVMPLGCLVVLAAMLSGATALAASEEMAARARQNGVQAEEALSRSLAVVRAYLRLRDPVTGLLPRKEKTPTWYVRDSAADLYPFLVIAAYYTDRSLYEGEMLKMLRDEIRWSTRVGWLSDNVLAGGGFEHETVDMDRIIYGSSEYAKDGLLPLTELLGPTAWFERMTGITDDLIAHAPYPTSFGKLPSLGAEVNGEMLQVLTRLAYRTRDPRYEDQAVTIARFYFEEAIPKSNGLPPHAWNLERGVAASEDFRFHDHGNEIVGGLAELVLYLKLRGDRRGEPMVRSLSDLVDLLLKVGRNKDGVWYSRVALKDYSVLDARHAHCWGYLFNAVYTTWLITGEERYLDAVKQAMAAVTRKPAYLDDPNGSGRNYKSNAYSDAIESMIVFLNRLPNEGYGEVLDTCVERFLRRQRKDGIVEFWYGDGNYVRTALMYALMKSQGAWLEPWREDVRLGAVLENEELVLHLASDKPWEGKVCFDVPRHKLYFNMPVNYPRLNEFPEWFTVKRDALYAVRVGKKSQVFCGGELARGLPFSTAENKSLLISVKRIPGPPYSGAEAP